MPATRMQAPTRHGRRRINKRVAALAVGGVAAIGAAGGTMVASAAPPSFPDNIVAFPDRDFVSIEGYQNHVGDTALVEVTRDGKVIGSSKAVVQEGDVAFEVNHPGGVCWGNDTGLNVTPDIRPGDKVNLSFNGIEAGDTTVANAYVTGDMQLVANSAGVKDTLVVKGYAGPGVIQGQMEQRIIQPDLVDTEIGRRDIRAVPGPLTPAPKGGYSSSLTFEGDQFTATYVFQDPANALIASQADLGERAMSWQVEDADGNRQGLTIAEYGEVGGPGMGGCPAGPGDAGAPQPGAANIVRSVDKTSVSVTWNPTDQVPGAASVTGFDVQAVQQSLSPEGDHAVLGKRSSANATHAIITGLKPDQGYDIEVRSMAGDKMSAPYTVQAPSPTSLGDTTPPVLTATPANTADVNIASSVSFSSELNADIYFTTDGKPAVQGGLPSDTAKHYTAAIPLSGQVTINAVAFDRAGNFATFTGVYKPPADTAPAPAAVTAISGTSGPASATLSWAAPEAGVTGYGIQAYVNGVKSGVLKETANKTITITGLSPGTEYYFTVKARNGSGYGPESLPYGPLVPTKLTDSVTIATARWKSGDFRVTGTGSAVGAFVEVRNATATGPGTTVLGRGQVDPPVAPEVTGSYDIRQRNANAPAVNPGKIYVVSENGGVAGPFTVVNG